MHKRATLSPLRKSKKQANNNSAVPILLMIMYSTVLISVALSDGSMTKPCNNVLYFFTCYFAQFTYICPAFLIPHSVDLLLFVRNESLSHSLQDLEETLSERLWGLTEMFPEGLRNVSTAVACGTCSGIKGTPAHTFQIQFCSSVLVFSV